MPPSSTLQIRSSYICYCTRQQVSLRGTPESKLTEESVCFRCVLCEFN